ncbi:MAG: DsrE family protein [Deltaproteobacteria bacterium]|nr:DsrE family protein [Deltaproteobacteria bacterium]
MTEEKTEKILYMCTCGETRSEVAHIPFVLANAALAMDIEAKIILQGDGVNIAKKGYADTMPPGGGFPPMKDLLASFLELGGILWVCGPCITYRNIEESDLIEQSEITAGGSVNLAAIESDAVFVF